MNQAEITRTIYDAPVRSDLDNKVLRAIQDAEKRTALIQYLREHGLLSEPWGLHDE
jgi:hypothetical protein